MEDQMQRDTDAGLHAWMVDEADTKTWTQYVTTILTR